MIEGIQLKVCGLTRAEDARAAAEIGADFLGFILHPKSPRFLPLAAYRELAKALPAGPRRGAVMVEPKASSLAEAAGAGFDFFQIHFDPNSMPLAAVAEWSQAVGPARLWLAPKLRPGEGVRAEWLPLAETFLLDTFKAEGFGGTGRTGDWEGFARAQKTHPGKTWILAGGLNPENIGEAIARSGARFVDVNSGVESAPGRKDAQALGRLRASLEARGQGAEGRVGQNL